MIKSVPPIGIDLGTTFCCIAYCLEEEGKTGIVYNNFGKNTTPSYLKYYKTEKGINHIVGEDAKKEFDSKYLIYEIKRLMGKRFSEVESNFNFLKYRDCIEKGENDKIIIKIEDESYTPQVISSHILSQLKTDISKKFGLDNRQEIEVVITVPANFTNNQKDATKEAGKMAGFKVLRIINEPTAAALAYGMNEKVEEGDYLLFFDFGGGTLDISILQFFEESFSVVSSVGNPRLGGNDLDNVLLNYCIEYLNEEKGINLQEESKLYKQARISCEKCKIDLSNFNNSTIKMELQNDSIEIPISREQFEELCQKKGYWEQIEELIKYCVDDADLEVDDIKEIIFVGGSSKIPKVKEIIKKIFPNQHINDTLNPDEIVAQGAAIQARMILEGSSKGFTDITNYSLGIEIKGQKFSKIIEKNSNIPIEKTETYVTTYDNQTRVRIATYEGENENISENTKLAEFIIEGIDPLPAGQASIYVTFEIDENTILTVTACYKSESKNIKKSCKIIEISTKSNEKEIEYFKQKNRFISERNSIVLSKMNIIDTNKDVSRIIREEYSEICSQRMNKNDKDYKIKTEKLIKNISLLFEDYSKSLENNSLPKEEHEEIMNGIANNLKIASKFNVNSIPNLIENFKGKKEFGNIINISLEKCFEESKESENPNEKRNILYNTFIEIADKYKPSNQNNQETVNRNKIEDNILYDLRRANVDELIEKGDNFYKQNKLKEAREQYKEAYCNIIQNGVPNEKVNYDVKLSGNNFFLEEEYFKFHNKDNNKDLEYEIKCLSKLIIIYDKLHPKKSLYQKSKLAFRCSDLVLNVNKLKIDIIEQKVKNQDWYKEIEKIKEQNQDEVNQKITEESKEEAQEIMRKYTVKSRDDVIPFIKGFIKSEYFPASKVKDIEKSIKENEGKNGGTRTIFSRFTGILKQIIDGQKSLIKGKFHSVSTELLKKINGFGDLVKNRKVKKNA